MLKWVVQISPEIVYTDVSDQTPVAQHARHSSNHEPLMKFQSVCIESLGYTLPSENWTSADVEQKLSPLYQRLKLPEGRLELMTGIARRGFWPPDVRPSQVSVRSCMAALEAADIDPASIGCLVHGSVCRDFLEPATACTVHHQTGLTPDCLIYDVSNACLLYTSPSPRDS